MAFETSVATHLNSSRLRGGWENIEIAEDAGRKNSVKLRRNADRLNEDEEHLKNARDYELQDFFAAHDD